MSNRQGVWSLPAQYQAIADQDWTMAPGAPTGVSATAGSTQAEVSFTAPTFAGIPGTITQFKVTSSSGQTATGSSSPITVTGLTNGNAVTFTAQAQNAIGLGKSSDASSSVTPLAEVISGLFSTHVYDGTGSAQTITNNIDLSGSGGLVWIKDRDQSQHHALFDTLQGATKYLKSSSTSAAATRTDTLTSFNSNGFSLGNDSSGALVNSSGQGYVSWTFRKQPKFFDVVTYTGTGPASAANEQQVSHNLGVKPGLIIIKRTDDTGNWWVFTDVIDGTNDYSYLNSTNSFGNSSNNVPTTSVFNVGGVLNTSSATYVAYLFANNNNDGGFGPDSEDIIKCGSYTGGSGNTEINLGFEPQFLMIKRTDSAEDWLVLDTMRGLVVSGDDVASSGQKDIMWNSSAAEATPSYAGVSPQPNGFKVRSGLDALYSTNGGTYIYMAIRRPGMSTPTSASDVFALGTRGASTPGFTSNFPVDMAIRRYTSATGYPEIVSRLTGAKSMQPSENFAEGNDSSSVFDHMTGYYTSSSADSAHYSYMWKRAKGYFDVVAYTGTGSATTVTHNLGAVPEMMWVKARNATQKWAVYHSAMGNTKYVRLNDSTDAITSSTRWNDTTPTASVFTVGTDSQVNNSSYNYIAYLFATVAGVSKVGSYTGTGSDINIDCGFSNGARFVLIKNIDAAEHWFIFDSVRGITTSTSDPYLFLSLTNAQGTDTEIDIDPLSSGFKVAGGGTQINGNGNTHIFYAIA